MPSPSVCERVLVRGCASPSSPFRTCPSRCGKTRGGRGALDRRWPAHACVKECVKVGYDASVQSSRAIHRLSTRNLSCANDEARLFSLNCRARHETD
eukprot:6191322-Pleurochrysis_carterae.AAC.3